MQRGGMQLATKLERTKLSIKLIRSTIGRPSSQREIVKILGINKMHRTRVHEDSPRVWGLITKVIHLVEVERVHADPTSAAAARAARAPCDDGAPCDDAAPAPK